MMAEPVNLYLDKETKRSFEEEARSVGLSFSAYLRVMGRIFREPVRMDTTISDLRKCVQRIIKEEEGRV